MKSVYCIILIFFSLVGFAQSTEALPIFKQATPTLQGGINKDIFEALKANRIDSFNACGYVRFRIDPSGTPIDVECNREFNTWLEPVVLKSLSGFKEKWHPAKRNGLPVISEYLLLPIVVNYNTNVDAGCLTASSFSVQGDFGKENPNEFDSLVAKGSPAEGFNKIEVPTVYYHLNPSSLIYNKNHRPFQKARVKTKKEE